MKSIYDFPTIYEFVLQREPGVVATEVRSIQQLLTQQGAAKGRILELACGACAHGLLLAQQGHHVTGLDRAPAMLEEARQRAAANSVHLELYQADIIDFVLPTEPFDAAIFMYETFPVITAYNDILRHFAAVRRHMQSGGFYIIDLDAHKRGVGVVHEEWGRRTITLPNGFVETWNEDLPGDWVAGTSHFILHCRITLDNVTDETIDDWQIRSYSPWSLTVLMQAVPGWRINGFYAWRDLSPQIVNETHYFMVLEAV